MDDSIHRHAHHHAAWRWRGLFGAFKRVVSGGSLFMTEYTARGTSGTVAFAAKIPGHIVPVTVAPGQEYMIHRHGFLCARRRPR